MGNIAEGLLAEEGSLDGEDEQEEDGDELPASLADFLLATAEHDAPIAEEEDGGEHGDGETPKIGGQRDTEAEAEADEEGVGAGGDTQQEDGAETSDVVCGQGFVALAEGREEHADGDNEDQAEVDEVVVVGDVEPQHVAHPYAEEDEEGVLDSQQQGGSESPREADMMTEGTAAQSDKGGNGKGQREDDIFDY